MGHLWHVALSPGVNEPPSGLIILLQQASCVASTPSPMQLLVGKHITLAGP